MRAVGFILGIVIVAGLLAGAVYRQEVVIEPGADPWQGASEGGQREPSREPGADTEPQQRDRAGSPAVETAGGPRSPEATAGPDTLAGRTRDAAAAPASNPPGPAPGAEGPAAGEADRAGERSAGSGPVGGSGEPSVAGRPVPRAGADAGADRRARGPHPGDQGPDSVENGERRAAPTRGEQRISLADRPSLPSPAERDSGSRIERPGSPVRAGPMWQPFWTPFNTRASARGFADTIAAQTDLEIRTIPSGPGTYRVAYPYRSEGERRERERQIEESVGLRIDARPPVPGAQGGSG